MFYKKHNYDGQARTSTNMKGSRDLTYSDCIVAVSRSGFETILFKTNLTAEFDSTL